MSLVDGVSTWASYQIRTIAGCACARNAGNVFPDTDFRGCDAGMHHGTCVTHVPWGMSGWLTRGGGEDVPDIPVHAQPVILRIWQEAHWQVSSIICFIKIDNESATLGRSRSLILIILHHRMRYIEFIRENEMSKKLVHFSGEPWSRVRQI